MTRLRERFAGARREAGFTLIELLVASTMGRHRARRGRLAGDQRDEDQPEISKRAQNITTARWVLERLTREIRNGIAVDPSRATASEVSFRTYVRRSTCGGRARLPALRRRSNARSPTAARRRHARRTELRRRLHRHGNARSSAGSTATRLQLLAECRRNRRTSKSPSGCPTPAGRRPDRLRRRQPAQRDPGVLMMRPGLEKRRASRSSRCWWRP